MARVVATAVAGVHPDVMGIGPVPAVRKVLGRAGLEASDLDVVEINEAFASQAVACMDELGLDPALVNPNGGAIALGHPLGASGARLLAMVVHELAADRGSLRAGDHVHRRGPGDRDGRRAHRGLNSGSRSARDHRGAGRKPLPCVRSECHRADPGTGRSDPRSVHEMIDAQPTVVSLSDAAATKLRELTKDEPNPEIGLRVYVYSGGCSGYRYGMMLEDAPTTDDNVLSANGVRVYIDNNSVPLIQGSEIDYVDTLMGAGFTVNNPNAVSGCGCGSSFRTAEDAGTARSCSH